MNNELIYLIDSEIVFAYCDTLEPIKTKISEAIYSRDITKFEKEFSKLFSTTDGISVIISNLTLKDENIFYHPNVLKRKIQRLKEKYYNQFKSHLTYSNYDKISDSFHLLYHDIANISLSYAKYCYFRYNTLSSFDIIN